MLLIPYTYPVALLGLNPFVLVVFYELLQSFHPTRSFFVSSSFFLSRLWRNKKLE